MYSSSVAHPASLLSKERKVKANRNKGKHHWVGWERRNKGNENELKFCNWLIVGMLGNRCESSIIVIWVKYRNHSQDLSQ
jgi:hypothetical protein